MNTKAVWEREATDKAQLILAEEGHARLGDYDNGCDDLWQKIRIRRGDSTELSYLIKIETTETVLHPSDYLWVRLVDRQGEPLTVLKRYTDRDAGGGWRYQTVDLSRFAGRTVYLNFLVKTGPLLTTAFYLDGVALENAQEHRSNPKSGPLPRGHL